MSADDVARQVWRRFSGRESSAVDNSDMFAQLVAEAPVLKLAGMHLVSHYDLLTRISGHPAFGMAPAEFPEQVRDKNPGFVDFFANSLSVLPADDHRRLRSILTKEFSHRSVQRLRGRISDIVDDLLEKPLADGECEFVSQLAVPLPVLVTAAMLGFPEEEWPQVAEWGEGLIAQINQSFPTGGARNFDPISAPEFDRLRDYVQDTLRQRADGEGDDLITRLYRAVPAGRASLDEVVNLVLLLFMTGVDTVTGALSNAVLGMLRRPDAWRALVEDPTLAQTAFTEATRLTTPVSFGARIVLQDVELGGVSFTAGETVLLAFAGGNRDPRQFDEPNQFRWDRPPNSNVSFGHGAYYCIGAMLGTVESEIVLRALARHGAALAPGPDAVSWRGELAFNSPDRLDLLLAAEHAPAGPQPADASSQTVAPAGVHPLQERA